MEFPNKTCLSEEDLYTYISGRAGAERLRILETHLAKCSYCRQNLAEVLEILEPSAEKTAIENSEPSKAELDHTIAVIQSISRKTRSDGNRRSRWIHWPVAAAASICIAALSFLIFSHFRDVRKAEEYFAQAKGLLEPGYSGTSPANLRLSLPFSAASTNRSLGTEEPLRRAETLFSQALAVRESMVDAHLGLGFIYLSESKFSRARDEFQKVLDVREENTQAMLGRGVAQYEEAMHCTDPLRRSSLLTGSLSDFNAVLKLNSDSPEARYNKIWTLYSSGMHQEALREIELYLSRDSRSNWAEELRGLKVKMQATKTSAVGEVILRSAHERDKAALVELARQAPYQMPAAILTAMKLSLQLEQTPSEPGEPNSEDLRWAAQTLEEAYGDFTGDHSLRDALVFYNGLSPPQRVLKTVLDKEYQHLSRQYRESKFSAVLQGSKPLEHQYTKIGDFWQLADIHQLRGIAFYLGKADFGAAEAEFQTMLKIANRARAMDPIARAIASLAMISGMQRRFDNSLSYANRLNALAQKHKWESRRIYACMTIGNQYRRMGQLEKCLREYSAALEMSYRLLDGISIIQALENLGEAMDSLGRFQEAREYYSQALLKQDGYRRSGIIGATPEAGIRRLNLLCRRGELESRMGDYASAEASFSESLKSSSPGMSELQGRNCIGLAEIYFKTNRIRQAEDMLKTAVTISASGQYPDIGWQAKSLEGRLLERKGNAQEAIKSFQQSIEILERMRQNIALEDLRYSFYTDRFDPFRMMISLLYKSGGDKHKALEFVDKAKSLTLKEHLKQDGLYSNSRANSEVLEKRDNPYPIIEYFFTDDGLLIFFTGKGQLETVSQRVSKEEISRQIRIYLESVQSNDSKAFMNAARLLYDILIAPVEKSVFADSSHPLVILPDGPLHILPFAGLQDSHGRFLIEKTPVAFAPSRSIFEHCLYSGRNRSVEYHTALLIDGSANLPRAREELSYLSKLYGKNASILSPQDLPAFDNAVSRTQILHYSGHADDIRGKPALLLRPSPQKIYLDCLTINRWKMPHVQLVNLAGCSTATGPLSEGEAPWGLVPAFLNAGAPAIIASLMPVDDLFTKRLSMRFYDLLKHGAGKAKALQEAQVALLESARSGSKVNPQSWLPYILIGNPQ